MIQSSPPPLCPELLCQGCAQISPCKELSASRQLENKNASPGDAAMLTADRHLLLATLAFPLETTSTCVLPLAWLLLQCQGMADFPSITLEQNQLALSPLISLVI